ncbi:MULTISPECIES: tRNA cyclic N6-threonylcarbamoyladenosine(37) synthase TcdA [unclassified Massilia]|uniref:tRNA cyclic N6-threonylcarbamoyladenosine(37) synthase TcdA n=1 Tax=unclassified Massilia TaxID=2609279 RepID=UPI00178246FC|nr:MULTISPECIES: tRNA cyclic N6-threonylcarbamoyladenosine(37) synthase TcdA [unclassified Massilia]MBD8532728.1 tRNA cyclic N6-threonylcarbamoyladenosine(37) synthase TcdA [Massilia sp. CFBP 13647]MBD8676155.1 tRNA cyclic N6-threonylcarbamoyladenosine(37) synthase TcdA [Massilia sp. CFBP 13721]
MNSIDTPLFSAPHGDDIDFARRFGGVGRLYGERALERFRTAHVCVIGVGGVGSWLVEALARSAIGHLTLIDLDNVAESNINRQIQAVTSTIGQPKIEALRDRIAQINPFCQVTLVEDFIEPDNIAQMIGNKGFDYVVDAIDSVKAKAALIAFCREQGIPLLTSGGAGGQLDPTKIEVRDLARTEQEPLLKKVRKVLRAQYGFSRGEKQKYHIDAVFSMEPLRYPEAEDACEIESSITGLNCAGFGSSMVVTASFGMIAAAHILRKLAEAAAGEAADATVSTPQQEIVSI